MVKQGGTALLDASQNRRLKGEALEKLAAFTGRPGRKAAHYPRHGALLRGKE
jgi:hypothetical protein